MGAYIEEEIKKFNERVYKDLSEILGILNKKLNLKFYTIIFDSEKNYCTSIRVKKTVTSNHNEKYDINQENIVNKDTIFKELNIKHDFDKNQFFEQIKLYLINNNICKRDINGSISKESKLNESIISNNLDGSRNNDQRILFSSEFNVKIGSGNYSIIYLLEIRNLDIETLDIYYTKSYCSYLRLILDYYFLDYYPLDNDGILTLKDSIKNKYNEDYIYFIRRMSRVVYAKLKIGQMAH